MSAPTLKIDRRAFLALSGSTALTACLPGIARGASALRIMNGSAFTTRWSIATPDGINTEPLRAPIEAMLAGIDSEMSPWRAGSDISRFNRSPAGTMKLPDDTLLVTRSALALAETSGGEFDPTVGPLVSRYGFGPIKGDNVPDWRGIGMTDDAVSKAHDGLTLDLCGIAKGYALDCMAGLVAKAGHTDFLIDLGGELRASGSHPSGRPWQVAIEDPRPGLGDAVDVLRLIDGVSVATSGNRANGYTIGKRRYSHIIDPLTGEPVAGDLGSVTVVAQNAMMADGWATALFAAGAEKGPELARRAGIDALFVRNDPKGLTRISTGSFGEFLA